MGNPGTRRREMCMASRCCVQFGSFAGQTKLLLLLYKKTMPKHGCTQLQGHDAPAPPLPPIPHHKAVTCHTDLQHQCQPWCTLKYCSAPLSSKHPEILQCLDPRPSCLGSLGWGGFRALEYSQDSQPALRTICEDDYDCTQQKTQLLFS